MGACKSLSKFFLIVFNILFLAIALAAIALAIWLLVDQSFSLSATQEPTEYKVSVILLLVTSICLGITSIFGICGSANERSGCLFVFCSLLLIILGAEISAGIWGYVNRNELKVHARDAVKKTVNDDYHQNEAIKTIFDTFQNKLECCGADQPSDWIGNKKIIVGITTAPTSYTIPASCCRSGINPTECRFATEKILFASKINNTVVFTNGCTPKLLNELEQMAGLWMSVGITIIALQVLSLIFALCLVHGIKSSKKR